MRKPYWTKELPELQMLYEKDETEKRNEKIYREHMRTGISIAKLAEKYNLERGTVDQICKHYQIIYFRLKDAEPDSIWRTHMSIRTKNALCRAGICTISKLKEFSEQPDGLKNIILLGEKGIEECYEVLNTVNKTMTLTQ